MAIKSALFSAYSTVGHNTSAYKIYLLIEQLSKDLVNNTSQVRFYSYMVFTPGGTGTYNNYDNVNNYWLKINGAISVSGYRRLDFQANRTIVIADKTVTVSHDAYGKKNVTGEAYQYIDDVGAWKYAQVAGSLELETIPRSSKFTASNVSAGAGTIPITLTKSAAATTHKVTVKYGTTTVVNNKDIGASPTYIPMTTAEWDIFYNLTKTVTSGALSITLDTYNGTTLLGSETANITVTYASTDIPSITGITISDSATAVNNVIGAANYLQHLSRMVITGTGAAGIKGSTISAYEIQVLNNTTVVGNYSTNGATHIPTTAGTNYTAKVRVKDSRGRYSAWKTSTAVPVYAYSFPKINSYTGDRATSAGVLAIDGTYIKHSFNLGVASVIIASVQKNNIRYKIDRTAPTAANILTTQTVVNTAATGTQNIGTYAANAGFEFLLTLTDAFGQTDTSKIVITSANYPLVVGVNGSAIGGLYVESGATAQIYGSLMATGYANFKEWARFEKYVQFDLSTLFTGVATFNSVPNFNAGTPVVMIPANADLNSYTTPGEYFCPSNATTQTIANTPSNWAFFLKVGRHAGCYQEFTEYHATGAKKYVRNNYNGTWGPWSEVLTGYVYEVERGGNLDTGYVKYSDRRMEQWKTLSVPGITFTSPLGALYYAGYKAMGDFLLTFATYNTTCSLEMECSQPDVFCVHGGMPNSKSAGNIYPFSARNVPSTVFKVRIRAWGTW